jgi:hypothetical protein
MLSVEDRSAGAGDSVAHCLRPWSGTRRKGLEPRERAAIKAPPESRPPALRPAAPARCLPPALALLCRACCLSTAAASWRCRPLASPAGWNTSFVRSCAWPWMMLGCLANTYWLSREMSISLMSRASPPSSSCAVPSLQRTMRALLSRPRATPPSSPSPPVHLHLERGREGRGDGGHVGWIVLGGSWSPAQRPPLPFVPDSSLGPVTPCWAQSPRAGRSPRAGQIHAFRSSARHLLRARPAMPGTCRPPLSALVPPLA